MKKTIPARRAGGTMKKRAALSACMMPLDLWESLESEGYTSLAASPDVAAAAGVIADVISSAPIYLMRNTADGDVREKSELSRFMDIHPYSLGTRKTLISWIIMTLLTSGEGNAFVLPVTQGGYLEDLLPMPGAAAMESGAGSYTIQWRGREFSPDDILHFVFRPDMVRPWLGRGVRVQLRDVLKNLRQSAATTNAFLSNNWKPSVIVKVDALADEFSTPAGRRRLVESYIAGQKAGDPWVIPADLMEVVQVKPLSLADLAISDNVTLDKRTVAAAFGVPPFLIGVGDYNQDAYNNFIRRTVIPIATGIQQELTKKLLLSSDRYFKFSTRKLYAYSLTELARVGDDQYIRGIMSGNEVRDWLDLSPVKGLDERVILENYIPAGMVGEQKKLKEAE